jgi:GT2 family glycosyltransferase
MKMASITVVYNDERFIRPHFKMISCLDEKIVLYSKKPFKDYFANGLVKPEPDNSIEILRKEFPYVHLIEHNFDFFCGDLFNLGMEKARELGCDVIIKLDPDMLMEKESWNSLINQISEEDWDTLLLDYQNNTIAYKGDLEHGHQANIFPVGLDPHVVRTNHCFIQDGVAIRATGRQKV